LWPLSWLLLGLLLAPVAIAAEGDDPAKTTFTGFEEAGPETATFTGSEEAGTGSAEFRLGYYHNGDSGDGNPFLNERLTVVEPTLIVDYNITNRLGLWGLFSYDYVSSASIERLDKFRYQGGASGDMNYRGDLGLRYELDEDLRVGGYVNGSTDYDYNSIGFGGDVAKDLANKNATLKLAANFYYDWLKVIRFDGDIDADDDGDVDSSEDRTSASATLSWYQVINPKTHGELGLTLAYQNGFLETPYNAVVIQDPDLPRNWNLANLARGYEITEELPSTRVRGALFGKVRRWLQPGTSIQLESRLYTDSWGIFSGSVEPMVFHEILPGRLSMRLGYRFYSQTAADDYGRVFRAPTNNRTQDSQLSNFASHGIIAKVAWQAHDRLELDVGGRYVFQDDGLDYVMGSIGIRWDFEVPCLAR
jgi:hypothetical protein